MPGRRPGIRAASAARLLAGGGLAAVVLAPSLPPAGPVLLEVVSPAPGSVVGYEGVDVLVRFPGGDAAAPETFRALLNGADVTDALDTGANGAWGELRELLEGENVLRVEVFGRAPWAPGALFEQAREVRVRMTPPLDLHRG